MRSGAGRAGLGLALFVTACQVLTACQTTPLRPLPADDPRGEELLERWSRSAAGREALRALVRLSVDSEGEGRNGAPLRVRSKQRIVIARPARLRVEVQGLLGTTAAVLAVDEEAYAWFDAGSGHSESGPVHDGLLWNVVRLDLTPSEAVAVILGAPPIAGAVLGAWDVGEGTTRLALGLPGGEPARSVDLDHEARLRRFAVFETASAHAWEARFDDYALLDGVPFAQRVSIETGSGTHAVLRLADIELNPALTPDIFRFERPGSAGPHSVRPHSARPVEEGG